MKFPGKLSKRTWLLRTGVSLVILTGLWFDLSLWQITSAAASYRLPVQPADAIVILGCGPLKAGEPGPCQVARTRAGVELWQAGYAPYLILTGGDSGNGIEAQYLATVALGQGVPVDRLVLETQSHNTLENLRYSKALLKANQWRSIILVSEPYHLYRARQQAADQSIEVVGWWPATASPTWRSFSRRSLALARDSLSLMVYEVSGWLSTD